MLVDLLTFTSVYFFESRLFKGLRPIQTKKFRPLSQVVAEPSEVHWSDDCFLLFGRPGVESDLPNGIARLSAFAKKNRQFMLGIDSAHEKRPVRGPAQRVRPPQIEGSRPLRAQYRRDFCLGFGPWRRAALQP